MDELEFRRRTIAQPNDIDKELMEFADNNPERQSFINDMKEFDQYIQDALDIPVPENLADRILLNTSLKEKALQDEQAAGDNVVDARSRFKFDRVHLALAASFFVAIGAFFMSTEQNIAHEAGEHALAHVYYEINALDKKKPISLQSVNDKLAVLGGHIEELPGAITYAMFCDFKGEKGLHLIFESDFGPMTVFIVPSENKSFGFGDDNFRDERFEGHINRGSQADTILVASVGAPLNIYNERVTGAIRWL
ncbi:DUF3379 family protein [Pseudoalteromonas sp. SG45-5]|uniref:DUF3379 family protein n=1 Tax=unclassified Pseudoalteromonas TaxID=194690 RepID=UPI0015F7B963|nr:MULTISPECIES: DUF3379 family protein [unclassified Pseudoalteromonas]MBB1387269.1 DUF3379 family protein [Pseudoalteromonas sp. SG45-5]MBB1395386.1 DUF3379 family protein [Pseudoalteromonas sp. SG44-4]